ncbi:MAG: adenylyltransferase/cytidyltransferase family protein [Acidobacteriota bacterium]
MSALRVVLGGPFDDLRSSQVRLLHEASKLGPVRVLLWSDEAIRRRLGRSPKFPVAERRYLLESIRFVEGLAISGPVIDPDAVPEIPGWKPDIWVQESASPASEEACRRQDIEGRVLADSDLAGFPMPDDESSEAPGPGRRVIVTGCFDWLHSGHVRFFEEVARIGLLYVVLGHDDNIRLLKGAGHPHVPAVERRYLVGSIRYVHRALISSGHGWLDAEPEIARIRPHVYAVNEDGDRPEKRRFCSEHGIEYRILKRLPRPGLPPRSSTELRGF